MLTSASGRIFAGTIRIHSGWKVRLIGNELSRPEGMPPVVMVFAGAEAVVEHNRVEKPKPAGAKDAGAANQRRGPRNAD